MLPSSAGTRLADGLPRRGQTLGQHTLTNRVEVLEQKVERLEKLPERMDSLELQFVQFREEVRVEFSAMRGEFSTIRAEIRAGDEQTRVDLRAEIRAGDEETRTYMRVLHEEVLSRIALLDEHRNGSARFRPPLKTARRRKKR